MIQSSTASYENGNVYNVVRRLESSSAEFGLANKNLSSERISALKNVDIAAEPSIYPIIREHEAYDAAADQGLNDRNPVDERLGYVRAMHQRVVENHGFDAKKAIVAALTHNTKIVNIPPDQRGTIADLSA